MKNKHKRNCGLTVNYNKKRLILAALSCSLLIMLPITLVWSKDKTSTGPLIAYYQISTEDPQLTTAATPTTLVIWRNGDQVAHQQPQRQISEVWFKQKNANLSLTRYFDQYQQGIEYQARELHRDQKSETPFDWSSKYQLISASLLQKLTLVSQVDGVRNFKGTQGNTTIELQWLAEQQLVKWLKIQDNNTQQATIWQLNDVSEDQALISAQFARWSNYNTTDYADIGDKESDPFIAKMIRQGFSAAHP